MTFNDTKVLPVRSIASTNLIRLGGGVSGCVNCLVKSRTGATETAEKKKDNFLQTSAYNDYINISSSEHFIQIKSVQDKGSF